MRLLAKDLTEKQQDAFMEAFPFTDDMCPTPWCCVWYYRPDLLLEGDTIEEMAEAYYETVKDDIEDAIQNDEAI